jgi:phosphotriesterase-related protein
MKTFYKFTGLGLILFLLSALNLKEPKVTTVKGEIPVSLMGKTLHHEHLLVDFIGADSTGYHRWNKAEVVEKVLPYLLEIKKAGYNTLVDCTPAYLGRDPELLKILSEKSGIQIITNTGYYSAVGGKYFPEHGFTENAEQLAQRWITEAKYGIEETGVFPGFIKIAVEQKPLEEINRKVIEAACITHRATGLVIMSHTGLAEPAFQQLEILKSYGINPSAFIWTHAHNEPNFAKHIEAAKLGTWIAFDNFTPNQLERFVAFALLMKKEGLLNKVLFSHDAGWYDPGKPDGGMFRGFTEIEELLIPALKKAGLNQTDINQLFVINPANAFKVEVRLIKS